MTSGMFGPKTLPTRGPERPFRCLDWDLGTHQRFFVHLIDDIYPQRSWYEWFSNWFIPSSGVFEDVVAKLLRTAGFSTE